MLGVVEVVEVVGVVVVVEVVEVVGGVWKGSECSLVHVDW